MGFCKYCYLFVSDQVTDAQRDIRFFELEIETHSVGQLHQIRAGPDLIFVPTRAWEGARGNSGDTRGRAHTLRPDPTQSSRPDPLKVTTLITPRPVVYLGAVIHRLLQACDVESIDPFGIPTP